MQVLLWGVGWGFSIHQLEVGFGNSDSEYPRYHVFVTKMLVLSVYNEGRKSSNVMANVPNSNTIVNKFEPQLRYNIHFWTNTLEKGMNSIIFPINIYGGARGVIVIVIGNGHGDSSSNPGREWLHFTSTITLGKGMNPIILPPAMGK